MVGLINFKFTFLGYTQLSNLDKLMKSFGVCMKATD